MMRLGSENVIQSMSKLLRYIPSTPYNLITSSSPEDDSVVIIDRYEDAINNMISYSSINTDVNGSVSRMIINDINMYKDKLLWYNCIYNIANKIISSK